MYFCAKDKLLSRGFDLDVATFQSLENVRKELQVKTQDLQEKRNSISKEINPEGFIFFKKYFYFFLNY